MDLCGFFIRYKAVSFFVLLSFVLLAHALAGTPRPKPQVEPLSEAETIEIMTQGSSKNDL